MKVYTKKAPDVISFAEARELELPEDVVAFATGTQHRAPMPIEGIRRDQAVRQYMRENGVTDYYRAFQVVALGYDPRDVLGFAAADSANSAARNREREVANRLAAALAGTRAVRDEG